MRIQTGKFWYQVWRGLTGRERWYPRDDLENMVPDDIGVTRVGDFWYVTATYGTGDDHEHVEIKLNKYQLAILTMQAGDRLNELRDLGGPPAMPPTQPPPAQPPPSPQA